MNSGIRVVAAAVVVTFGAACGAERSPAPPAGTGGFSAAYTANTTLAARFAPVPEAQPVNPAVECGGAGARRPVCRNPAAAPLDLTALEERNLGKFTKVSGTGFTVRDDLAPKPDPAARRRSLTTFVHLSDPHITDEESPMRMGTFDNRAAPGSLRPQDMYTERVLDDMVRTINWFGRERPFEFTIVTGDITDTGQENELKNAVDAILGGPLNPDSGADDDPVPGENNDPQDPFVAMGLSVGKPRFVLGNHDLLVLGVWPITAKSDAAAAATLAEGGTRDGTTFEVVRNVVADPSRRLLQHRGFIDFLFTYPKREIGLGLDTVARSESKGYYTFDFEGGVPIRVLVMDTAHRLYGYTKESPTADYSDGVLDKPQVDNWLKPQLERAKNEGRMVILASHHQSGQLSDEGDPARYVGGEALRTLLLGYDNVILHLVGHGHQNRVWLHKTEAGKGYWEVEASSLIDHPQQGRFWEFIDNGDGTMSMVSVVVDHFGEPGSLSYRSRELALLDHQSGWGGTYTAADAEGNVELLVPVPAAARTALAAARATSKLEHTGTWAGR